MPTPLPVTVPDGVTDTLPLPPLLVAKMPYEKPAGPAVTLPVPVTVTLPPPTVVALTPVPLPDVTVTAPLRLTTTFEWFEELVIWARIASAPEAVVVLPLPLTITPSCPVPGPVPDSTAWMP